MQCPKCYGEMDTISSDGANAIRIDRCSKCEGLYFDQLTRADLSMVTNQDELDTGNIEAGAEYNEMTFVDCPKCNKMMDQRRIEDPVHIRFEHCTSCYATFLDAGELKQYLSEEYREQFEALLPA